MPSFLSPILKATTPEGLCLVSAFTGEVIAYRLLIAFDSGARRTGLLRHPSLDAGTAMVIAPCSAVHTFFMKFAIDVIFVAKDGRVLKVVRCVQPWRLAGSVGAFCAIEVAADTATVQRGEQLIVRPRAASD